MLHVFYYLRLYDLKLILINPKEENLLLSQTGVYIYIYIHRVDNSKIAEIWVDWREGDCGWFIKVIRAVCIDRVFEICMLFGLGLQWGDVLVRLRQCNEIYSIVVLLGLPSFNGQSINWSSQLACLVQCSNQAHLDKGKQNVDKGL